MVPKKFGRVARRWLDLVISAVMSAVFAIAASTSIKAQPEISLLSQSPTTAAPSSSEALSSRQAFGGQLAVLLGHKDVITSAEFSPDGRYILTSASQDQTVRLWDSGGNFLTVLQGHTGWINTAVFSPDGRYVLTASLDKTARLWDLQGNLLAVLRGHEGSL